MALEVLDQVEPITEGLVCRFLDDFRASAAGAGVVLVDVVNEYVHAGANRARAGSVTWPDVANHDHAISQSNLGMSDGASVSGQREPHPLGEPERLDQPGDRPAHILVEEVRRDLLSRVELSHAHRSAHRLIARLLLAPQAQCADRTPGRRRWTMICRWPPTTRPGTGTPRLRGSTNRPTTVWATRPPAPLGCGCCSASCRPRPLGWRTSEWGPEPLRCCWPSRATRFAALTCLKRWSKRRYRRHTPLNSRSSSRSATWPTRLCPSAASTSSSPATSCGHYPIKPGCCADGSACCGGVEVRC